MYKVEVEDLPEQVYQQIKNMILNGELPAGKKLVQEELAARLGVSRTPLLTAFRKLESSMETSNGSGLTLFQYIFCAC